MSFKLYCVEAPHSDQLKLMHPQQKVFRYRGVTYHRTGSNQVPYEEYKRQSLELSWLKERVKTLQMYEDYLQHLCSVKEDTES